MYYNLKAYLCFSVFHTMGQANLKFLQPEKLAIEPTLIISIECLETLV